MKPLQLINGCALIGARRYDWGIHIEYTGPTLEALRSAECITPRMYRALGKPSPGTRRRDANGDCYKRRRKPPRIIITRQIRSGEERAMGLPGVSEALGARPAADRAARMEQLLGQYPELSLRTAFIVGATDARDWQTRSRTVGRFQRLVEYATVGNLVVPNWVELARARLAETAGAA